MSDTANTPEPTRAPFDSDFESEESRVRARAKADSAAPASAPASASTREQGMAAWERTSETVSERTTRIDHKMSVATMVLKDLLPTDGRARLLASAILRRDEVLMDAVLAQMTEEVVALVSSRRRPNR